MQEPQDFSPAAIDDRRSPGVLLVLHAIAVIIVESFGISGTAYAAIAEAHMQVRAARNQVGWFLRSKSIGSSASYSDIQFKIVNINIVYQDY